MAYLYLNFLDNLDKGLGDKAWGRNDFFTQSLNEQYETLKRKLGGYAPDTLQEFIGYTFPSTPKYYNVSLPSFDRAMDENKRGNKILRNIVIRPEVDGYSRVRGVSVLQSGQCRGERDQRHVPGLLLAGRSRLLYDRSHLLPPSCRLEHV